MRTQVVPRLRLRGSRASVSAGLLILICVPRQLAAQHGQPAGSASASQPLGNSEKLGSNTHSFFGIPRQANAVRSGTLIFAWPAVFYGRTGVPRPIAALLVRRDGVVSPLRLPQRDSGHAHIRFASANQGTARYIATANLSAATGRTSAMQRSTWLVFGELLPDGTSKVIGRLATPMGYVWNDNRTSNAVTIHGHLVVVQTDFDVSRATRMMVLSANSGGLRRTEITNVSAAFGNLKIAGFGDALLIAQRVFIPRRGLGIRLLSVPIGAFDEDSVSAREIGAWPDPPGARTSDLSLLADSSSMATELRWFVQTETRVVLMSMKATPNNSLRVDSISPDLPGLNAELDAAIVILGDSETLLMARSTRGHVGWVVSNCGSLRIRRVDMPSLLSAPLVLGESRSTTTLLTAEAPDSLKPPFLARRRYRKQCDGRNP
jgi:hypothetical protein